MESGNPSGHKTGSAVGRKPPRAIPAPNYTQLPNEILEDWLPNLAGPELKIVAYICRQTFGWHKDADAVLISDIAHATGMNVRTVQRWIPRLVAKGCLDRTPQRHKDGGNKESLFRLKTYHQRRRRGGDTDATTPGDSADTHKRNPHKKEPSSSSERSVKVSSSMQAADQTAARPLAATGKKSRAEELIRRTLEDVTHIPCRLDDPKPGELLNEAEKQGANYAVLAAFIHWKADAKRRCGDAIRTNGFFTPQLLAGELPAYFAREPRLIGQLTDPMTLADLYPDIEGLSPEPDLAAAGEPASHSNLSDPVSSEATTGPGGRGSDLTPDGRWESDGKQNEAPAAPTTPTQKRTNRPPTQAQSLDRKPPACAKCNDYGSVSGRNGDVIRCNCPASEYPTEEYLEAANRFRGKQEQAGAAV